MNRTYASIVVLGLLISPSIHATTVQFQTVLGNFEVNLYDQTTPETVENFLSYVDSGAFANSFIHRSDPGFIIQGGGFIYDLDTDEVQAISSGSPVRNEPEYSNRRGTIAMAKRGGDPNSATSQWFFNLADNSANLDGQNGGFTVFGEVSGNGMAVVDTIAQFSRFDFRARLGPAFGELPLRNYSSQNYNDGVDPTEEQLVMILGVVVLDGAEDTAAGLNPVPNTAAAAANSGGSGGAGGWVLLALGIAGLRAVRTRYGSVNRISEPA